MSEYEHLKSAAEEHPTDERMYVVNFDSKNGIPAKGKATLCTSPMRRCAPLRLISSVGEKFKLLNLGVGVEPVLGSASGQSYWSSPNKNVRVLPDFDPIVAEVGNDISLQVENLTDEPQVFCATMLCRRLEPGEPACGWGIPADLNAGDVVELRTDPKARGIVDRLEGPWAWVHAAGNAPPVTIDLRFLRKVEMGTEKKRDIVEQRAAEVMQATDGEALAEAAREIVELREQLEKYEKFSTKSVNEYVVELLEHVPGGVTADEWKSYLFGLVEGGANVIEIGAITDVASRATWMIPRREAPIRRYEKSGRASAQRFR